MARYKRDQRDLAYRIYVTDALKVLGGLNVRYASVVLPQKAAPPAEKVISRIKEKLGGK